VYALRGPEVHTEMQLLEGLQKELVGLRQSKEPRLPLLRYLIQHTHQALPMTQALHPNPQQKSEANRPEAPLMKRSRFQPASIQAPAATLQTCLNVSDVVEVLQEYVQSFGLNDDQAKVLKHAALWFCCSDASADDASVGLDDEKDKKQYTYNPEVQSSLSCPKNDPVSAAPPICLIHGPFGSGKGK
jgi:hypothetical protein